MSNYCQSLGWILATGNFTVPVDAASKRQKLLHLETPLPDFIDAVGTETILFYNSRFLAACAVLHEYRDQQEKWDLSNYVGLSRFELFMRTSRFNHPEHLLVGLEFHHQNGVRFLISQAANDDPPLSRTTWLSRQFLAAALL